ncbi:MAG: SDR family oxidoreductase [Alphaproteobacteria bacterium]|nr:SDR family oxidoreductase [Alphaproteobacteria bacterium]
MHRIAKPKEITDLALVLASSAASYITGTAIPIDGGALAW